MKFTRYPKRDAIRDYFPLPNEIFSLGLSTGEIAVYAYLMYCEDRKTFQCHPSYKTIGKAVGMSKNTVRKHVDGLTKKRLITTEPTSVYTQKGEKRNGNLLYTDSFPDRGCGGVSLRATTDTATRGNKASGSLEKTRRI